MNYYKREINKLIDAFTRMKVVIGWVDTGTEPHSYKVADELDWLIEELRGEILTLEQIRRNLRNLTEEEGKWDF